MTTDPPQVTAADEFDGRAALSVPRRDDPGPIDRIEIDRATYADGDFRVVAYDARMEVIGTSDPLEGGEVFEGPIHLDRPLTETQAVTVVLHHANGEDDPGDRIVVNDMVVLDSATVGQQAFLGGEDR